MQFDELSLHPTLARNLVENKFLTATPIQERGIPVGLEGKDVVGLAQTGTGKTLAFLVPIIQRMLANRDWPSGEIHPKTLVLAPTRELVQQIYHETRKLVKGTGLIAVEIIGGVEYHHQRKAMEKGVDIIIATPGRLIDYTNNDAFRLNQVRFLVLDEADRMFDMGFQREIRLILSRTPKTKQAMMFSATMPYEIFRIARDYMNEPTEILVDREKVTTDNIEQIVYHLGRDEKMPYLVNLILTMESDRVLIFTNMRIFVTEIVEKLLKYGVAARGISSLMPQRKRTKLMDEFRAGTVKVLVATDLASRGIDVEGISHVFNYDLPQDSESFVHRIGRTARAGRSGVAISFCSEMDYESLEKIEKLIAFKLPTRDVDPAFCEWPKGNYTDLRSTVGNEDGGGRARGERSGRGGKPGERDGRRGRDERPRRDAGASRPGGGTRGEDKRRTGKGEKAGGSAEGVANRPMRAGDDTRPPRDERNGRPGGRDRGGARDGGSDRDKRGRDRGKQESSGRRGRDAGDVRPAAGANGGVRIPLVGGQAPAPEKQSLLKK